MVAQRRKHNSSLSEVVLPFVFAALLGAGLGVLIFLSRPTALLWWSPAPTELSTSATSLPTAAPAARLSTVRGRVRPGLLGTKLLIPDAVVVPGPLPERKVYVGVLSAPGNVAKRDVIRRLWLDAVRRDYGQSIRAEFLIGHEPSLEDGKLGERGEMIEGLLGEETNAHQDIVRLSLPEHYANLPDKTMQLVGLGVDARYGFIVKIDDDQALVADAAIAFADTHNATDSVYAGDWLFGEQTYDSQVGVDQQFQPYFSGPCYALSWRLGYLVTKARRDSAASYLRYGSSSEDVMMGRWVSFLRDQGEHVRFQETALTEPSKELEEVGQQALPEQHFIFLRSDPKLCVNAKDGTFIGALIILWECGDGDNAKWRLLANGKVQVAGPEWSYCWVRDAGSSSVKLGECRTAPTWEVSGRGRKLREQDGSRQCLGGKAADVQEGAVLRMRRCGTLGEDQEFDLSDLLSGDNEQLA